MKEKIFNKVAKLYGEELAPSLTQDILALVDKWRGHAPVSYTHLRAHET